MHTTISSRSNSEVGPGIELHLRNFSATDFSQLGSSEVYAAQSLKFFLCK